MEVSTKNLFLLGMLGVGLMMGISSCSDDDKGTSSNAVTHRREVTATGRGKTYAVQLWEGGPWWAEFNVGATVENYDGKSTMDSDGNPNKSIVGNYYNWGITVDQSLLNNKLSYCTDSDLGGRTNISGWVKDSPADTIGDAATKNWGSNWRMPTGNRYTGELYQLLELGKDKESGSWQNVSLLGYEHIPYKHYYRFNGSELKGICFKGKGDYANDSIFFPVAGKSQMGLIISSGCYWSSIPENAYTAINLNFHNSTVNLNYTSRNFGCSVRAVLNE